MPEFGRILCVVDDSDTSRRALDCALWWARWHGSDVSVLRVHQPVAHAEGHAPPVEGAGVGPAAMGAATQPPAPAPLAPDDREALIESIETFVTGSRTDGVQIEVLLDEAV